MIGRGTRLRKDLYGPGHDKADFLIFDFCGNFEFFNSDLMTADGNAATSLAERLFAARLAVLTGLDSDLPDGGAADPEADGTNSDIGLRIDLMYTHRTRSSWG